MPCSAYSIFHGPLAVGHNCKISLTSRSFFAESSRRLWRVTKRSLSVLIYYYCCCYLPPLFSCFRRKYQVSLAESTFIHTRPVLTCFTPEYAVMKTSKQATHDDKVNDDREISPTIRRSGRKRTPTSKDYFDATSALRDNEKTIPLKKSKRYFSKSSNQVEESETNPKTRSTSSSRIYQEPEQEEATEVIEEKKQKRSTRNPKSKAPPKESHPSPSPSSSAKSDSDKNVNEPLDTTTAFSDELTTKDKKLKAPKHQVLTERSDIAKLWNGVADTSSSYTFKVASWNVAGLRAVMKNNPDALDMLVKRHNLDVLCLQETKLQDIHLDDPKLRLRECILNDVGYDSYYSCSKARKGYSGTAVFIKRHGKDKNGSKQAQQKTINSFYSSSKDVNYKPEESSSNIVAISDSKNLIPVNVTYAMGIEKHDQEGRLIVVDFPLFTLCNVYVPNSGQNLDRLKYRTDEWDKDFVSFLKSKQATSGRPILWVGDLNVAHTNLEVWNDGAKHLDKQAGVTPEERKSFQEQLDSGGYVDAFRRLHPTASGHYTYWSVRAGNRQPNKGLRLDYFICDPVLFDESNGSSSNVIVRDCYMDYDQMGSDHCPIIIEMEIKL